MNHALLSTTSETTPPPPGLSSSFISASRSQKLLVSVILSSLVLAQVDSDSVRHGYHFDELIASKIASYVPPFYCYLLTYQLRDHHWYPYLHECSDRTAMALSLALRVESNENKSRDDSISPVSWLGGEDDERSFHFAYRTWMNTEREVRWRWTHYPSACFEGVLVTAMGMSISVRGTSRHRAEMNEELQPPFLIAKVDGQRSIDREEWKIQYCYSIQALRQWLLRFLSKRRSRYPDDFPYSYNLSLSTYALCTLCMQRGVSYIFHSVYRLDQSTNKASPGWNDTGRASNTRCSGLCIIQ